jgi:hypothetical protein
LLDPFFVILDEELEDKSPLQFFSLQHRAELLQSRKQSLEAKIAALAALNVRVIFSLRNVSFAAIEAFSKANILVFKHIQRVKH